MIDTHLAHLSMAELVADQPIGHTPDGRPVYDNTPTVVVVVVFLEGDHILVIRRAHNPGKGFLGLPGGYHMHGETWQEAGSREVLEETGYMVDPSDIQFVSMETDEYGNNLVVAFGPGRLSPDAVRDAEAEEVLIVSLEDVPSASEWAFPRHYKAVLEFVNG